jgi:lysophospholipase L1-like esterase
MGTEETVPEVSEQIAGRVGTGNPVDVDQIEEAAATIAMSQIPAFEISDEPKVADRQRAAFRELSRLLDSEHPVTWVFVGDRVTLGAQQTHGWRNYVEHFAERVRWELRRFHDVIINTGISGESSRSLLKKLDWRVLRFEPNAVSIMIGMNDAMFGRAGVPEFEENLRTIIDRIRDSGAFLILHTPHRIDVDMLTSHADLRGYVRVVRKLAAECDVPLIDHWEHWNRLNLIDDDRHDWLADDGLQPGRQGHKELAGLMFKRMGLLEQE